MHAAGHGLAWRAAVVGLGADAAAQLLARAAADEVLVFGLLAGPAALALAVVLARSACEFYT